MADERGATSGVPWWAPLLALAVLVAGVAAAAAVSSRGDGPQYRFDVTGGMNFAGGRGNALLAVEYFKDQGIDPIASRKNIGQRRTNLFARLCKRQPRGPTLLQRSSVTSAGPITN